jgi:hypothetical protein
MTRLRRFFLGLLSWFLPARLYLRLMRKQIENLRSALEGAVAEGLLEALLEDMSIAFVFLRGFRLNLADFSGKYLFRTSNGNMACRALFANRHMQVLRGESKDYDVAVTFKDPAAFFQFLFSRDQDILASLLADAVVVDGNLNYIYKFAFMARDLMHRLRLADLVDRLLARLRMA